MIIESVELVASQQTHEFQERYYRARMENGEVQDLFWEHWDVHLPPESLVGLTVDEARRKRRERMLDTAQRYQRGHWRGA